MNLWWASLLFEPGKLVLRWVLYNRSFKYFKKQKLVTILFKNLLKRYLPLNFIKHGFLQSYFSRQFQNIYFSYDFAMEVSFPLGCTIHVFQIINTKSHNLWKQLKRNRPSRYKSLKHSRAEPRSLFKFALTSKVTLIIIKTTKNYSLNFCSC